jgi:hypothetical protein
MAYLAVPAIAANDLHDMFANGSTWHAEVDNGPDAELALTADGHGTMTLWPVVTAITWTARGNDICLKGGPADGQCFGLRQVAHGFTASFDGGRKLVFRRSQ